MGVLHDKGARPCSCCGARSWTTWQSRVRLHQAWRAGLLQGQVPYTLQVVCDMRFLRSRSAGVWQGLMAYPLRVLHHAAVKIGPSGM